MSQNENDEPLDDLELEITDLDETAGDTPRATLLSEKAARFLRKHRKPVTFATTGLVLLAILLILFSIAPLRQFFIPPVQQNTFDYKLDANPPWGRLFVDGQPVKVASDRLYPLFSLSRGEHTLLWHAEPFAPQQCVISVPAGSGSDTCKHPQISPSSDSLNSYISFPVDLTQLKPAQRLALLQATQAAFDSQQSSEIMREGDVYAQTDEITAPGSVSCTVLQIAALCLASAHQSLKATLRLQLDTSSWSRVSCWRGECESNGQNCYLFCDVFQYGAPDISVSPTLWQANVFVQLLWRFSELDGRVIVDNQADSFIRGQQNDLAVTLNIAWNGQHWSVSTGMIGDYAYTEDPVCSAAMGDLYSLENAVPATTGLEVQTSIIPTRGTTFASGCLIAFTLQKAGSPQATPTSSPPSVVYVMQRFGVLLAVNSAAHRLFPFLPIASPYEKQLAQQWAVLQSGNISLQPFHSAG